MRCSGAVHQISWKHKSRASEVLLFPVLRVICCEKNRFFLVIFENYRKVLEALIVKGLWLLCAACRLGDFPQEGRNRRK